MTQPLTSTPGGQAALADALARAVPAWIDTLAALPKLTLAVIRSQAEAALAEADLAAPGDDVSWETKAAFLALARCLALDAYRPGGVTYLGMHWEATREAAPGPADTVATTPGLLCDPLAGRVVCPDGGTCGHGCTGGCWRTEGWASPLTAAGWGDTWPAEVLAAERAKGPSGGVL